MTKYIDKTVIENILHKLWKEDKGYGYIDTARTSYNQALQEVQCEIDTLDVKEIDLEDSVKEILRQKYIDYTFKRHNIDPESREGLLIYYAYMHGMNQCLDKLNAIQKEEEV